MKDTKVAIYKSGTFYNVYGDGGLILYILLGYKYVEPKCCVGFPTSAFSKVISTLEKEKISYVVYEKNNVVAEYKGISKNYCKLIKEATKKLDIERRMNRLWVKINNLSNDELEKIIELIEDATV